MFKSPKFKVSSEIHAILTIIPYKIEIKKLITYFQHHRIYITTPKHHSQCWYQGLWNLWHHIGDSETHTPVATATATISPESTWLTSHLYLWLRWHPYIKEGPSNFSLSSPLLFQPLPCPFFSQKNLTWNCLELVRSFWSFPTITTLVPWLRSK